MKVNPPNSRLFAGQTARSIHTFAIRYPVSAEKPSDSRARIPFMRIRREVCQHCFVIRGR